MAASYHLKPRSISNRRVTQVPRQVAMSMYVKAISRQPPALDKVGASGESAHALDCKGHGKVSQPALCHCFLRPNAAPVPIS